MACIWIKQKDWRQNMRSIFKVRRIDLEPSMKRYLKRRSYGKIITDTAGTKSTEETI